MAEISWNSTIVFTTGAVLTAGQLNNQIGQGGNMDQTATAIVTTAGDIVYATGSKALARLGIGTATQLLHGGASAPSWSQIVNADIATAAAITHNKLSRCQRCKVANSASITIPNNSDTAYSWDGEVDDLDSWHASGSTNIVPTRQAVVLVIARIAWSGNATGRRILRLAKNTSEFATKESQPGANNFVQDVKGYSTVDGVADYIKLTVYQDSGGNLGQYGITSNLNSLEVVAFSGGT